MTSTSSFESAFPPPSYAEAMNESSQNVEFTFVDFFPDCTQPGGFLTAPTLSMFGSLIDRANNWLTANPHCEVIRCESVKFKATGQAVECEKMTYIENGEHLNPYIRGLRIWILRGRRQSEKPQEIGYLNLIPQQTGAGGLLTEPTFGTLQDLLDRFNSLISTNPLPGRIFTVECIETIMKISGQIEPDRSNWGEVGSHNIGHLFFIRIFYEKMPAAPEEIGITDFVPVCLDSGGIFKSPIYEPFSNVVRNASDWYRQQIGIRFCNAQSLDIKIRRGGTAHTQKMNYMVYGNTSNSYLRILRMAYTRPNIDHKVPPSIQQITCKTFVPVQLSSSIFMPEFETLSATKNRVSAWIKATGAHVLSAETIPVRISSTKYGAENCYSFSVSERNKFWLFVIRLYLNGFYKEPSPEMLPPVPQLKNTGNCAVS